MSGLKNVLAGFKGKHPRQDTPLGRSSSVLLIDDEDMVLHGLRRSIHTLRPGWTVLTSTNGLDGLQVLREQVFGAVICDMSMPGMHGIEVLSRVRDEFPDVTRIALTGLADEQWKMRNQTVAHVFLSKPCQPRELIDAVECPDTFLWPLDAPLGAHIVGRPQQVERQALPIQSRPQTEWNERDEVNFS